MNFNMTHPSWRTQYLFRRGPTLLVRNFVTLTCVHVLKDFPILLSLENFCSIQTIWDTLEKYMNDESKTSFPKYLMSRDDNILL